MQRFRPLHLLLIILLVAAAPSTLLARPAKTRTFPKGDIDVYLLSGQSNMDGRGKTKELAPKDAYLAKPFSKVLYYYHLMPTLGYAEVQGPGWQPLQTYMNRWDVDTFGPELSFGHAIAKNYKKKVAILKLSQGGASLYKDFCPEITPEYHKGKKLYPWLIREANRAIGELRAKGYNPHVRALIWVQGWTDAFANEMPAHYETNLRRFFKYIRADFNNPNLPIVINQVHPDIQAAKGTPCFGTKTVMKAQEVVAAEDPNTVMIPSTDMKFIDIAHFTTDSYIILGNNLAKACTKLTAEIDTRVAKEKAAAEAKAAAEKAAKKAAKKANAKK